ncbi:glycosyltransferase [Okeania sp. SIO2B9]|uniref:glycosyltransferase n=1 Tax=Okeania sp. SIO2B9 TaxID=2607782 RepID=UPI00142D1142|nr:glycosyltransferase [Okeania sp. SIO2B9]NES90818.1 glycosyltransferase [Okeania sp. SIO2B9]
MTHFGAICPTHIGIVGYEAKVLEAGLEYLGYGKEEFPEGAMTEYLHHLSKLSGIPAFRYIIVKILKKEANALLQDTPQLIKDAGIDALLIDSVSTGGVAIAELLEIPFITIYSVVLSLQENTVPPIFTNWKYNPTWWAKLRNKFEYRRSRRWAKPLIEVVSKYRTQWNLPLQPQPDTPNYQLAQISHQPAELEFPRENLPKCFHFTGPYHYSGTREPVAFPWDKLTGKPLIYASLGSLVNRFFDVFDKIAVACDGLDAQLVMSLGGSATPESLPNLPGNPLVVKYAPQLELLQKVTLTITHAGMNTTLECLNNGVPMIAIPIAFDQPGVAARIAWSGAGEAIPLKRLTVARLRKAISKVLTQPSYKQNALRLQSAIQRSGGVTRAADIIEQAVSTGKPVLAGTI